VALADGCSASTVVLTAHSHPADCIAFSSDLGLILQCIEGSRDANVLHIGRAPGSVVQIEHLKSGLPEGVPVQSMIGSSSPDSG
jgi:hypothetical protein